MDVMVTPESTNSIALLRFFFFFIIILLCDGQRLEQEPERDDSHPNCTDCMLHRRSGLFSFLPFFLGGIPKLVQDLSGVTNSP